MTIMPPPQYDFPPAVPVIEHAVEQAEVMRNCGDQTGCARVSKDRCEIWFPRAGVWITFTGSTPGGAVMPAWAAEQIRRHELAHCNGWPRDHRG